MLSKFLVTKLFFGFVLEEEHFQFSSLIIMEIISEVLVVGRDNFGKENSLEKWKMEIFPYYRRDHHIKCIPDFTNPRSLYNILKSIKE